VILFGLTVLWVVDAVVGCVAAAATAPYALGRLGDGGSACESRSVCAQRASRDRSYRAERWSAVISSR